MTQSTFDVARDIAISPNSYQREAMGREIAALLAEIDKMRAEKIDSNTAVLLASGLDVDIGNIQIRIREPDKHAMGKYSHYAGKAVELLFDGKSLDHICWTSLVLTVKMEEAVRCDLEFLPRTHGG